MRSRRPFAAPIGSDLGAVVGWRGAFWSLVPFVVANLLRQWFSLPSMAPQAGTPLLKVLRLLRRRYIAFAMASIVLMFAGAFAAFTYLRPFLESSAHVSAAQLSLLLLALGVAGFAGTYGASAAMGRHLYALIRWLPLTQAAVTVLLVTAGQSLWAIALAMAFVRMPCASLKTNERLCFHDFRH